MTAPEVAGSGAVASLSALLDQLTGTTPPPPAADPGPPTGGSAAAAEAGPGGEPLFADVDSFVRHYLAPVVERRLAVGSAHGAAWCPEWWRHPEAITRLYALWRAWETLRVGDPDTGMSIWWRDHFDPHFAQLTGELGPFSRCGPDRGHLDTSPLPIVAATVEVLAQLPDYEP